MRNPGYKAKNFKTDLEQLKKLFIVPESHDKFLDFGHDILDMIHNFLLDKQSIRSSISLPDLEKLFSQIDIPRSPHLLKEIFAEIEQNIIANSVKVGSPYYVGHMTSAVPYFTILIEIIMASLNQNQVKIETARASTFVERELLSWIHRLIYNREPAFYTANIQNHNVALGNVTLDGTLANLTAMLVARNKLFKPEGSFKGITRAGLAAAYSHYNCEKAVIIVSQRGHYSFDKIARIIGIGDDNIIKIPVDQDNKINIKELEKVCSDIEEYNKNNEKKIRVLSLIGIAGTTETGNIDNLDTLNTIARRMDTHFHVDAAWGGPVLLVNKYKHLFRGIESADSVTFDSHKLLYSPLSAGMVLFKDENDLSYLKHVSTYILRPQSMDQGRFTVEGSRPFSALRPWVALKVLGSEGFKLLFENAFSLTSTIRNLVETHPNFEPINNPELFIFNYRYAPGKVQMELRELMNRIKGKPDSPPVLEAKKRIEQINKILNDLNKALHRMIRAVDNSFVSRTVLESTRYTGQPILVLRSVTINPLTTAEILEEIITEQNLLGEKLYQSRFKKRL